MGKSRALRDFRDGAFMRRGNGSGVPLARLYGNIENVHFAMWPMQQISINGIIHSRVTKGTPSR